MGSISVTTVGGHKVAGTGAGKGGTGPEQTLHQKIAELNAEQKPAPPPSAPKAQAKVKQAAKQKLSEPPRAVPAQAETGSKRPIKIAAK